ncbi:MAG: hypothetical protein A3E85_04100 [Gammaproteobacteria bacterium RIFCSPHIGHO2_12_FULL_45_12]|nr:MAG: hypothetical protein A3E85_04100 [Gammaproteobacteria bacterium RIFCSPHIGHO2_12_FULL_45_12]
MQARKVTLTVPLKIDVARIASFYPEFRYRAPYPTNRICKGTTSKYILNNGDQDRFAVLFFDEKNEDGFNTIYSAYSSQVCNLANRQ